MSRTICHLTTAHLPFDTRVFHRECRSLAKAGYRVFLVAPHPREETVDGVHILPLPPAPASVLTRRAVWPALAARRALTTGADLFHFHDPEMFPAMEWLARRTGRPVLWDAHEVFGQTIAHFNQFGWRPASRAGARLFERYEIQAARRSFAGVVTITEMMAERYRRAGLRTAVVGNYVEADVLERGAVRPPKTSPPLIVTSGQMFLDRGILLMVEALARVRGRTACRLAFWGHFSSEEDERRLRGLVRERGLEAEVFIGGPYPRDQLLDALLPTATVGCVLLLEQSDYNTIGVPTRLTEYWARGLPVIASRNTNAARMTAEVGGGLVSANTVDGLAEAFAHMLDDRAGAEAMGERGRAAVAERFSWTRAFGNLLELYHAILGPPAD